MNYNFISSFLDYTADAESPTSFFVWSAVSALSAVMKDQVYWDVGHEKVYPNIYVLLIAKSGVCRKNTPVQIVERLVSSVGTVRVISGRSTVQAIVKDLGSIVTTSAGVTIQGANALIKTPELSAFFHDDPETIKLLTDLYDAHETWTNSTVGGGKQTLNDVCLSMLAASNEILLKEVFTSAALYGGLLARTFVIMESKRRHKNSRTQINLNSLQIHQAQLKAHLHKLSSVKGPIRFTDTALAVYEDWYMSIDDDKYASKSGVEARLHTGVVKLAMCLAAAEERFFENRVIHSEHVEKSIEMAVKLLPNYEILTMSAGRSLIADPMTLIIRSLLKSKDHQTTRRALLRNNFGDLDVETLDKCIITLEQTGVICSLAVAGETGYRLTERFVAELMKKQELTSQKIQSNGHIKH